MVAYSSYQVPELLPLGLKGTVGGATCKYGWFRFIRTSRYLPLKPSNKCDLSVIYTTSISHGFPQVLMQQDQPWHHRSSISKCSRKTMSSLVRSSASQNLGKNNPYYMFLGIIKSKLLYIYICYWLNYTYICIYYTYYAYIWHTYSNVLYFDILRYNETTFGWHFECLEETRSFGVLRF